MQEDDVLIIPEWLRKIIVAAGVYNIIWGLLVTILPDLFFKNLGTEIRIEPFFWRFFGLMVATYGLGYLIAAKNVVRYWPIVLIGFLVKLFGTATFIFGDFYEKLPVSFSIIILFNDVIWLIPFGMILYYIYRDFVMEFRPLSEDSFLESDFNMVETNKGIRLSELANQKPVLLVFLRHFGCTFCRETLKDLKRNKKEIEESGKELVLVHMSTTTEALKFLSKYDLQDEHLISDINRDLYHYFGLRRGFINEVFGIRQMIRVFISSIVKNNRIGGVRGDIFQLPGIFVYYRGRIRNKYIHKNASDKPDIRSIARQKIA